MGTFREWWRRGSALIWFSGATLALSLLMGCAAAPKVPIPSLSYRTGGAVRQRHLLVLVRGLGAGNGVFAEQGIIDEIRRRHLPFDVIAPDVHYGYYKAKTLETRLKEDLIDPARREGYEQIWLAGFSIFLFLSLAMVKRFSELENLRERGITATHGRGYLVADIEQIRSFGTSSATASVVVFSMYISRPAVAALYEHASRLWLIVPLMLYWLYRVWLLGSRGEMDTDPVIFALRDRISLFVGLCVLAVAISAL